MVEQLECREHITPLKKTHQTLNATGIQLFEPAPVYDSDASDSTVELQDIAGKRVNPAKLIALLRRKFGAGRFKIRVRWTSQEFQCRDIADFSLGCPKCLHNTSPQASVSERDPPMQMKILFHTAMHTRMILL